jgi:hypothetical protein
VIISAPFPANCGSVFNPQTVYHSLYRAHCLQAAQKIYSSVSFSEYLCQAIENRLTEFFSIYTSQSTTSVDIHRSNLQQRKNHWENLKSNRTCLTCLQRKPEHVLPCAHAVCDVCVYRFGEGMVGYEYRYLLDTCLVCSSRSDLIIDLKGPTTGVSILCVDGGGSRGVIPLEFLSSLQEMAGPDLPIQDFFDLKFGTSAGKPLDIPKLRQLMMIGGLIVLGLSVWDVAMCIDKFRWLTKRLFGRDRRSEQTLMVNIKRMVKCWFFDGMYDSNALEATLQDSFGPQTRLFGYSPLRPSGPKVAVTASNINEASAFVFSNYNGEGHRRSDCGEF